MLHKKVSDLLTNQVISTIQGGVIKPITSMAVSEAVKCVSESIQKKLNAGKTVMEEIQILQSLERMKGKYHSFMNNLSEKEKKNYQPVLDGAIEEAKKGKGNLLHLMVLLDQLEAKG
jgi:hypothetical protein